MREQIIRRPPPAVLLAMASAARGAMTRDWIVAPASVTAATAVIGGPLYLLAGSAGNLLHRRTMVDPTRIKRAQHLVMDDPNRLARNLMYLGLTDLLLSHAIARRNLSALILLAGFAWLIDRHQISAEKKALEKRFKQDYLDYKKTVPRWLNVPGPSPGDRSREPRVRC